VDSESGRLRIEEDPDSDSSSKNPTRPRSGRPTKAENDDDEIAGAAYREQMTSIDGFTRTPNGQVKFHKNTKKRRADEANADQVYGGDGDIEMGDGEAEKKKAKKSQQKVPLGQEFKAKVCFPLIISLFLSLLMTSPIASIIYGKHAFPIRMLEETSSEKASKNRLPIFLSQLSA
jgi:hypothetical protein